MRITFIWHDCFVVETESATLVFDYWRDPVFESKDAARLPLFVREIDKEKPIYVFVSHHHKDHYSREIFSWSTIFPHIRFILSYDTARFARHIINPVGTYAGPKPNPKDVTSMRPGDFFKDSLISVSSFGSTDIGVSYVVSVDGETIFHAGDLNAWLWKDESTEAEVNRALTHYLKILDEISLKYPVLSVVMFPVDSRIGSEWYTGASLFVRRIDVKRFFPMHFCLGDTLEERLRYRLDAARTQLYANPERGEYICLQSPYSAYICH